MHPNQLSTATMSGRACEFCGTWESFLTVEAGQTQTFVITVVRLSKDKYAVEIRDKNTCELYHDWSIETEAVVIDYINNYDPVAMGDK